MAGHRLRLWLCVCGCLGGWGPEQLPPLWMWWFVCVQGCLLSVDCITPILHCKRVTTAILSSLVTSECPLLHTHTHTHTSAPAPAVKANHKFPLISPSASYIQPAALWHISPQHQLPDTSYQERFGGFLIHFTLKTSFLSMKGDVTPMLNAEEGGGVSGEVATGPAFHRRWLFFQTDGSAGIPRG